MGRWSRLFRPRGQPSVLPQALSRSPLPRGASPPSLPPARRLPRVSGGALGRVLRPVLVLHVLLHVRAAVGLSVLGGRGCWPPAAPTAPPPAGRAPWRSRRLLRTSARAGPPADESPRVTARGPGGQSAAPGSGSRPRDVYSQNPGAQPRSVRRTWVPVTQKIAGMPAVSQAICFAFFLKSKNWFKTP